MIKKAIWDIHNLKPGKHYTVEYWAYKEIYSFGGKAFCLLWAASEHEPFLICYFNLLKRIKL